MDDIFVGVSAGKKIKLPKFEKGRCGRAKRREVIMRITFNQQEPRGPSLEKKYGTPANCYEDPSGSG